jgi:hypothetical protein
MVYSTNLISYLKFSKINTYLWFNKSIDNVRKSPHKMKKTAILILLTTLIFNSFSANAQRSRHKNTPPKLSLGVKAGINYAGQSTSDATELNVKKIMRFNGGVYFNYYLLNNLAIQPEIMISGKGVHWNDQFSDGKDLLTYIDVPIMVKYQPLKMVNIQAGPDFGYRVSAKQSIDGGSKVDIGEYYKKSDMGLAFGMEANLPFRLNISLRYVLGLTSVTAQYSEAWKNNFFQLSVGYRLVDIIK